MKNKKHQNQDKKQYYSILKVGELLTATSFTSHLYSI